MKIHMIDCKLLLNAFSIFISNWDVMDFLKVKLTQKKNKRNELVPQLVSNPQPLG